MNVVMILTAVISFAVTALAGKLLIPALRRLHFGQSIREDGPTWHKQKQGTPTMGGIMFIVGSIAAVVIGYCVLWLTNGGLTDPLEQMQLFGGLIMALLFGLIGFLDDYIKVVKKRNLGLTAKQKLILQFGVAAAYLFTLSLTGVTSETLIPFVGPVDLGWLYWILSAVLIVGVVNAVNLSDGIDGLVGSMTFFAALAFMLIASTLVSQGIGIMSAALAGGCLGFLIWNFHPAKVFMGLRSMRER